MRLKISESLISLYMRLSYWNSMMWVNSLRISDEWLIRWLSVKEELKTLVTTTKIRLHKSSLDNESDCNVKLNISFEIKIFFTYLPLMYEAWLLEATTNFEELWNWVFARDSFTIGCWTTPFVSIEYKLLTDSFRSSGGLQAVRRLWEARSLLWLNARPHTLQTYGFSPRKLENFYFQIWIKMTKKKHSNIPVWVRMWMTSLSDLAKLRLHKLHLNGFSPVCCLT